MPVRSGGASNALLTHFGIARPSELAASKFGEALQLAGTPLRMWPASKAAAV
jgi:hypothetical protein